MNERNEPLRSLAAGMQSRVSAKLGDIWWAFMLRGAFAGVLGILCADLADSYFHNPDAHDRSLLPGLPGGRSARSGGGATGV